MPKLSDQQIKQRLQEGRNYKRLYFELKLKYDEVVAENKQLKQELADQRAYFEAIIETQAAQIAELQTMVFGRKPKGGIKSPLKPKPVSQPRANSSYRRPIPPASAITGHEHYAIENCHRCGHVLTDKSEAIRYQEDIRLAALDPRLDNKLDNKKVTERTIETGWCSRCGQYSSAQDLRGQVVTIGPIIRSLVVYLVVQSDQTYSQVVDLIWQLYRFRLTSGEITSILASRRMDYLPVYEQLKNSVRAGPAHLDETSYPVQSEKGSGYAHVMVGADGAASEHDVIFRLADSRGKSNSLALVGEHYSGVGITDRYGSYKDLFQTGQHQICWAHLHRTARDLTRLECLTKQKQKHVALFYRALAAIYDTLQQYQSEPFDQARRMAQATELLGRTTAICQAHTLDPKKLSSLKAGILEYQDCLFLCLSINGIPADNNKAERALRKLVIKRKKSFGVKTMNGARTMEVLLSVCQSLYNRDRDNFLPNLHALATVSE